jgi:hypothetical protein
MGTSRGAGVFRATGVLLLQKEAVIDLDLSLLGQYCWGFQVTWTGAFIGLVEAGGGDFLLGYLAAPLRNWEMTAYAVLMQRRVAAKTQCSLLEQVQ